jgi:hypothetical protein
LTEFISLNLYRCNYTLYMRRIPIQMNEMKRRLDDQVWLVVPCHSYSHPYSIVVTNREK